MVQEGDTVYIIGKRTFNSEEKPHIEEAIVQNFLKHRQNVAYGIHSGTWFFSKKHLGVTVFKDRTLAEEALVKVLDEYNSKISSRRL